MPPPGSDWRTPFRRRAGLEATRRIRAGEATCEGTPHVHIIAVTAHASDEDKQECLSTGMDEFLTKPVQPDVRAFTSPTSIRKRASVLRLGVHLMLPHRYL